MQSSNSPGRTESRRGDAKPPQGKIEESPRTFLWMPSWRWRRSSCTASSVSFRAPRSESPKLSRAGKLRVRPPELLWRRPRERVGTDPPPKRTASPAELGSRKTARWPAPLRPPPPDRTPPASGSGDRPRPCSWRAPPARRSKLPGLSPSPSSSATCPAASGAAVSPPRANRPSGTSSDPSSGPTSSSRTPSCTPTASCWRSRRRTWTRRTTKSARDSPRGRFSCWRCRRASRRCYRRRRWSAPWRARDRLARRPARSTPLAWPSCQCRGGLARPERDVSGSTPGQSLSSEFRQACRPTRSGPVRSPPAGSPWSASRLLHPRRASRPRRWTGSSCAGRSSGAASAPRNYARRWGHPPVRGCGQYGRSSRITWKKSDPRDGTRGRQWCCSRPPPGCEWILAWRKSRRRPCCRRSSRRPCPRERGWSEAAGGSLPPWISPDATLPDLQTKARPKKTRVKLRFRDFEFFRIPTHPWRSWSRSSCRWCRTARAAPDRGWRGTLWALKNPNSRRGPIWRWVLPGWILAPRRVLSEGDRTSF